MAQRHGLDGHADDGQGDGDGAPAVDLFAEQHRPRRHVQQGVDVIAQAGLQRRMMGGGDDVEAPVRADQQRRQRQPGEGARIGQDLARLAPLARQQQHRPGDEDRPDRPVGQDFGRAEAVGRHRHEQQRQQAPQDVAGDGRADGAGIGGGGGRGGGHDTCPLLSSA
jgi:hypothetical protein